MPPTTNRKTARKFKFILPRRFIKFILLCVGIIIYLAFVAKTDLSIYFYGTESSLPVATAEKEATQVEAGASTDPVAHIANKTDKESSEAPVETDKEEAAAAKDPHKLIQPGNHTNIPVPEKRIGPNGEEGYVHDPKFLINNPRPFSFSEAEKDRICAPPGKGDELPEGAKNLNKIRNHMETSTESRDVKLFCAVYTYNGGVSHTDAIQETWGKKCDGLLFASSQSNATTGHMHLPSNSRHGFGYKGMLQRTRSILAYLYDNFLDDYDHFHIVGDDVYLIVENLKEFLASEKVRDWDEAPDQYMIAGFWLHWGTMPEGYFYLGGGSGYTLSRKALKAYVEGPLQTCDVGAEGSAEDVAFSDCAKGLSTKFIDTRDAAGAHRYHQMPVQRHSTFPGGRRWGFSMFMVKQALLHMERNFSFPLVYNDDYISNSSVSFHKHDPTQLRRYEMLLYRDGYAECGEMFIGNSTGSLSESLAPEAHAEKGIKSMITTDSKLCPPPDEISDASFPLGFPQNLTFGRFVNQKGTPFITQDFWADIVDKRRTFFLRPHEAGFPPMDQLRNWIRSRPHPITLVMNNQVDESWPVDLTNKTHYELILNETNLHAVYAGNARNLKEHPKLKPLPIGFKWSWRSSQLFGEQKDQLTHLYANNSATTPEQVENLFKAENRTSSVWLRPMMNSNKRTQKYVRDTPALKMMRAQIAGVLNKTAPETFVSGGGKIEQADYFMELKKHRFMVSPPGNGLDTHSTWEALIAGCIPIVPRSALDPVFEDLPVWLVDSWEEVTDESVRRVEEEMKGKTYNWEKVFASGWKTEIYKGLCKSE